MASHEFRTPLTTILSSTKLISRYEEGSSDHQEKRQKHVKRILGAIHGLNGILDDFLSISRLEEGKVEVRASVESLAHFCQDISELMSSTLKEGQTIQCSHIGKMEFCTDFSILKNIMYNLLSNAVKYSNEGKTIDLMANNRGKVLDIQVTDYGIGIPKAEQAKVFGRFFRAGNATNIQGTGLGLHIVKKYVDMLGGTISFESEPDLQTTFKISLPSIEI
jgi:signal transduction histidine kinase